MVTRFGVEIEAIFNLYTVFSVAGVPNMAVSPYHRGDYSQTGKHQPLGWKMEQDSSLYFEGEFRYIEKLSAEVISKPFTKGVWRERFDAFKSFFTQGKDIELSDIMAFNNSCGCHIRFSDTKDNHATMMTYKYLYDIRDRVADYIKRIHPKVYPMYIAQYKREQAKAVKDSILRFSGDKYTEFNATSLGKGMEWRGFNLSGVTTWEELYDIIRAAILIIDEVLKEYQTNSGEETIELEVSDELIGEASEAINITTEE